MNKRSVAIVVVSVSSLPLARQIKKQYPDAVIYSKESQEETVVMESIDTIVGDLFLKSDAIIFIGAMGICVRLHRSLYNGQAYRPGGCLHRQYR